MPPLTAHALMYHDVFDWRSVPNGSLRWLLTFDDGGPGTLDVGEELRRRRWRGFDFRLNPRLPPAPRS
jgi:hypothetical protein